MACLSGPHWATFRMDQRVLEHATAVWLNTTFGLVSLWGTFNRTVHGIGSMAETYASQIATLDLSVLTKKQIQRLHRIYLDLSGSTMLPASCAWKDPVRIELDQRVMQEVLGIRDKAALDMAAWLRNAWCLEPSVQAHKGHREIYQEDIKNLTQAAASYDPGNNQDNNPGREHTSDSPEPPSVPAISTQLLRDLANALDAQRHNPNEYREITLSAHTSGIKLSITGLNGVTTSDIEDLVQIPAAVTA